MIKLLGILCILGVVSAIPVPDDDDFKYAYMFNNVNPSVQTYRAVNEVRQPAVSFNTPIFDVDDDTFDFDDDEHRVFYSAQPQAMVVRQPDVVNNIQPSVQTYSAVNEVRQPAVSFNTPIFNVDDDLFDFDNDGARRFFYSAQPQDTVVRQQGVVSNVQPSVYSANVVRVDDDRYDFDDDDIRFVHAAQTQPQPTVMTYSANNVADTSPGQPITKTAETASETRQQQLTARSIPSTYQSLVVAHDFDDDNSVEVFRSARSIPSTYQSLVVARDFDDDNSGEVFRSFTPTNGNRPIAYSAFRDQSVEFEDFND